MPVVTSYPGLYIEEIPSNSHTISAAPTSIAVFVGYSHPHKTPAANLNVPVRIFSFSDYEREFGGFFQSGDLTQELPLAVYQFFLNGGSDAYVVALRAQYLDSKTPPTSQGFVNESYLPTVIVSTGSKTGLVFTAKEFVDRVDMVLTVSNVRSSSALGTPLDTFDLAITYGTKVETYRGLLLTASPTTVYEQISAASTLVSVTADSKGTGTDIAGGKYVFAQPVVIGLGGTFTASDFVNIFQADTPLDKVQIFNLLLTPGIIDPSVQAAALAFAERKRAFAILDPPLQSAPTTDPLQPALIPMDTWIEGVPKSQNAAVYFPYLNSLDPSTGLPIEVAPSGYVAGIYARTDTNRGVWKAPAGIEMTINNTTGVVRRGDLTDSRHGVLNQKGINCLRNFPGTGPVVFGARTIVAENQAFQQSMYVSVRRMTLFIEQTLLANLRWVVFEPNAEPLWLAIQTSIRGFMRSLYDQGALKGTTASQAFQVKCDSSTTTSDDINNGIVNIVVAFAPLKPAEFVVIKIAQLAGQTQA